jgi:N-acetylglucosamine kinase-like BadF-type ATPase
MRAYLGIDGGGTHTRSLLISESGHILGRAVTGPSNVQQISSQALRGTLQQLLDQTFINLADEIECVASCFGLAGAASAHNKNDIRDILGSLIPVPSEPPILTSDAHIALVGALGDCPGLMLVAGTGSICLGRDADGIIHRTGGWGAAFDDLGSGYWIGRQAVQMTFQESDGRQPSGPWQSNVLKLLSCNTTEHLRCKLKTGEIHNSDVAALAPLVIQLSQQGVSAAVEILNHAVRELVSAISTTCVKVKLRPAPLILVGGLLEQSKLFRDQLSAALKIEVPDIQIQKSLMSPIAGAVVVACKESNNNVPNELEQALIALSIDSSVIR